MLSRPLLSCSGTLQRAAQGAAQACTRTSISRAPTTVQVRTVFPTAFERDFDRDFYFPRLGFRTRMLGFRDPFEDFFTNPMKDFEKTLQTVWSDFGILTPDAHLKTVATPTIAEKEAAKRVNVEVPTTGADAKDCDVDAAASAKRTAVASTEASKAVERPMSDWLESYTRAPHVDVRSTENEFLVSVDVPGVRKEDVKINVTGDRWGRKMLNICGERKEESNEDDEKKGTRFSSMVYGKFSRSLLLPDGTNLEGIKAKSENGVLQITVPRVAVQPATTNEPVHVVGVE